jgi:hypothetical protein
MEVNLQSTEHYLLATLKGPVSLREALEAFQKTCDAAAERGQDKILIDCRAICGELSFLERYELGRTMAEHCLSRPVNAKIAFVGEAMADEFEGLVTWNRGVPAKAFLELPQVLAWLNAIGAKGATEVG